MSDKRPMQLRLDDELREQVSEYQKRLKEETGVDENFSLAVRSLLRKGLEFVRQHGIGAMGAAR